MLVESFTEESLFESSPAAIADVDESKNILLEVSVLDSSLSRLEMDCS